LVVNQNVFAKREWTAPKSAAERVRLANPE
jgi:hypothetical protein